MKMGFTRKITWAVWNLTVNMTEITAASFAKKQDPTSGITATGRAKTSWPSKARLKEQKGWTRMREWHQLFLLWILKVFVSVGGLHYPWRMHALHTPTCIFYTQLTFLYSHCLWTSSWLMHKQKSLQTGELPVSDRLWPFSWKDYVAWVSQKYGCSFSVF